MDSFSKADGELSDAELAQVAGGKEGVSYPNTAVAAVANVGAVAGIHCQGIGFHD